MTKMNEFKRAKVLLSLGHIGVVTTPPYMWADVKGGILCFYVWGSDEGCDGFEKEIAMFKEWSYWLEIQDDQQS